MGYTTEFYGSIEITPPLNVEEINWLKKHNQTRRMLRGKGPYFVDGTGDFGQNKDDDVINLNEPPEPQLSLWCQWLASEDGTTIKWDGGEKFYQSAEWMKWLIEHILGPDPRAKGQLPFLQGHTLSGVIYCKGEDSDDVWRLIVEDRVVYTQQAALVYGRKDRV
jgi:hypothetical protein